VYQACDRVPQSGPLELLLLKDELDAARLAGDHHRLALLRQLALPAEDVRWRGGAGRGGRKKDEGRGGGGGGGRGRVKPEEDNAVAVLVRDNEPLAWTRAARSLRHTPSCFVQGGDSYG
jgi:hypothetical protein